MYMYAAKRSQITMAINVSSRVCTVLFSFFFLTRRDGKAGVAVIAIFVNVLRALHELFM